MPNAAPLELESEEQALYFRTRRAQLAGPGAPGACEAAQAILGAQAQQEPPALFALSQRTKGRPTAEELRAHLLDPERRTLLRTWGQRDTLHLYAPADWRAVIAARNEWPQSGRKGAMPSEKVLDRARQAFAKADRPLFRRDLFGSISKSYLAEAAAHPGAGRDPERFAATRLIWKLAKEGEICFAEKDGSELSYAHRAAWFPELDWPELEPAEAATALASRYLATYAPATPADIAHFFGAKVATAKSWLARLEGETVPVSCGGRKGLLALAEDAQALSEPPPRADDWPLRFLPMWDTQTMTHKDKSWILPNQDEAPLVWRKAAMIPGTVLARGRIVATWAHKATTKQVNVAVTPLSGWKRAHRKAAETEAEAVASHLGLTLGKFEVET